MTKSVKEKSLAMALLEAHHLSLQKGSSKLLNSINFYLEKGEILAITGRSGSGKTTLLKLLCRMEEPSSGEIRLENQTLSSLDPREVRRRIQWVFQSPLLVGKTVLEDLNLGLAFSKVPVTEETGLDPETWMEKMHLAPSLLREDPKNLSVGEAQRVALVRAIRLNPQVLLLDEPTSALDAVSKTAIEESLRDCAAQGVAILLVTHDNRQMQELASRGLELSAGEIQRQW